ncbi:hypothetical protein GYB22_03720 [bacterium]|nr:hypothetical protein [bacterium]
MIKNILTLCMLAWANLGLAQVPFVCEGQLFMTNRSGSTSDLVLVEFDEALGEVYFNVQGNLGVFVNSIGYRSADNFIYGYDATNRNLMLVDANADATVLQNYAGVNEITKAPSGDVTADGKFLILMGRTASSVIDEYLVFIDLTQATYPVDHIIDISANGTKINDFAIHPVNGNLYGIDEDDHRLVVIDPANGNIVSSYPAASFDIGAGAIFFDQNGVLRAYGTTSSGQAQKNLFEVNLTTGQFTEIGQGPESFGTDACSCPYTLDFVQYSSSDSAYSCASFNLTLKVSNLSDTIISNGRIYEEFSTDFEIQSIDIPTSFSGSVNIVSGVNTSTLDIRGLKIPVGIDSIVLEIGLGKVSGNYSMQATLSNLPSYLGGSIRSDNPRTIVYKDSNLVYIIPNLDTTYNIYDLVFCEGDSVQIHANPLGRPYSWSHSNQDSSQYVSSTGVYIAEVEETCGVVINQYNVVSSRVDISDIPLTRVAKGSQLSLTALFNSYYGSDTFYNWQGSRSILTCATCRTVQFTADNNDTLVYIVTNEYGCSDTAKAPIEVFVTGPFWIPNAFSPNDDGHNDIFYIYGEGYQIIYFDIYDQWGKKHYELPAGPTGLPDIGWRGETIHDLDQNPNVYIYVGRLQDGTGMFHDVSGTITVMR